MLSLRGMDGSKALGPNPGSKLYASVADPEINECVRKVKTPAQLGDATGPNGPTPSRHSRASGKKLTGSMCARQKNDYQGT